MTCLSGLDSEWVEPTDLPTDLSSEAGCRICRAGTALTPPWFLRQFLLLFLPACAMSTERLKFFGTKRARQND